MALFTFRNNKDSFLPVSFVVDVLGTVEEITLAGKETRTVTAESLSHQTQNLIDRRYITLLSDPVAESDSKAPKGGLPLIFGGNWSANLYYPQGWVLSYGGVNYLVIKKHLSMTIPPDDTTNYLTLSVNSPEVFFDVEISDWDENELLIKTSTGWKASLISGNNVASIPISKVASLQDALDTKYTLGSSITELLVTDAPGSGNAVTNKTYTEATYVRKSGSTMTGYLTLSGPPSSPLHATSKSWTESTFLKLSGGSMTGQITGSHGLLSLDGGTLGGALYLASSPTSTSPSLQAATKQYTLDRSLDWKAGGTMTGLLVLSGEPSASLNPATKNYVDVAVADLVSTSGNFDLEGNYDIVVGSLQVGGLDVATEVFATSQVSHMDIEVVSTTTFTHLGDVNFSGTTRFDGVQIIDGTTTFEGEANFQEPTLFADDVSFSSGSAIVIDVAGNFIKNVATPAVSGDAANKEYVDITTFPITAGPANQLEGPLALFSTSTSPDGLYEVLSTGRLGYKGNTVVTRSNVRETSADYTVANDESVILVNPGQGLVVITIPSDATESDIIVQKVNSTGSVVIVGEATVQPGVLTTLSNLNESVTISPVDLDGLGDIAWKVTSRVIPDSKQLAVKFSLSGSAVTRNDFCSVSNVGGKVSLNFSTPGVYTHYKAEDVVKITGTLPYNADDDNAYYEVSTVDSSNNRVILDADFSLSSSCSANLKYQEISIQTYRKETVTLSVEAITDGGSSSALLTVSAAGRVRSLDGHTAVTGDNAVLDGISIGDQIQLRGHDAYNGFGRVISVDSTAGTVKTNITYTSGTVTDTIATVSKLVLPKFTDSTEMNLIVGDSVSNLLSNKWVNITGVSSNVTAILDVDSSSGITVGDDIRVTGTSWYDGWQSVLDVPSASEITIDAPWIESKTGKFIIPRLHGAEPNINSTLGNTMLKAGTKDIITLRTGVNGVATVRVSGGNDYYLGAFSSGWNEGDVKPLLETTGSALKFASQVDTGATGVQVSSGKAKIKLSSTNRSHGVKVGDIMHVSTIISWSAGSVPVGWYPVLAVNEADNTVTLDCTIGTGTSPGNGVSSSGIDDLMRDATYVSLLVTPTGGSNVIVVSTYCDTYFEDASSRGVGVRIDSDSEIITGSGTTHYSLVTDRLPNVGFTILGASATASTVVCQNISIVSSAKISL